MPFLPLDSHHWPKRLLKSINPDVSSCLTGGRSMALATTMLMNAELPGPATVGCADDALTSLAWLQNLNIMARIGSSSPTPPTPPASPVRFFIFISAVLDTFFWDSFYLGSIHSISLQTDERVMIRLPSMYSFCQQKVNVVSIT